MQGNRPAGSVKTAAEAQRVRRRPATGSSGPLVAPLHPHPDLPHPGGGDRGDGSRGRRSRGGGSRKRRRGEKAEVSAGGGPAVRTLPGDRKEMQAIGASRRSGARREHDGPSIGWPELCCRSGSGKSPQRRGGRGEEKVANALTANVIAGDDRAVLRRSGRDRRAGLVSASSAPLR